MEDAIDWVKMCWFFYIFRMLFSKIEPVDDGNDYIQAFSLDNKKPQGLNDDVMVSNSIEKSNDDVTTELIDGPSILDAIPTEIMANIASRLPFDDIVRLRQTSSHMNNVYHLERRQMKGPEIHVFVNLEAGQVVTSFRGHRQLHGEARIVLPENRPLVFRNSDVTLTLRFGDTPLTPEAAAEILNMFKRSEIQRVQLRAAIVSRESMTMINQFECTNIELNIGRYTDNVTGVLNIKDLRVREHLLFFQLGAIFRLRIESLSVRVTAASMPNILECIEEWRASRRDILSWFFKIPLMEVHRGQDIQLDWRSAITVRHDRSARLRTNSRIEPLEAGELIQYQTLCWFLN
ncbi:unnamed protein product [Caenorhabditis brenneri]